MQDPNLPCGVSQADIDACFGGDDMPAWAEEEHEGLEQHLKEMLALQEHLKRKKFRSHLLDDIAVAVEEEISYARASISSLPQYAADAAREEAEEAAASRYDQQRDEAMEVAL